jgi:hypothetical protein
MVLSGGYHGLEPNEGTLIASNPNIRDGRHTWFVQWKNASPGMASNVFVAVHCADLGAAH